MTTKYQFDKALRYSFFSLFSFLIMTISCIIAVYGFFINTPAPAENPPNILFKSDGGPVIFWHRHHYNKNEAAIDCADCHHNYQADAKDKTEMNCRQCHYKDPDIVEGACSGNATHPRCIGGKCVKCHDGEDCNFCHRKKQ